MVNYDLSMVLAETADRAEAASAYARKPLWFSGDGSRASHAEDARDLWRAWKALWALLTT